MAGKKTKQEIHEEAVAQANEWLEEVDVALQENDNALHGERDESCSEPYSIPTIPSHG